MVDSTAAFEGGCHCGGVRFRVHVRMLEALSCNCSVCRMTGFVHVICDADDFELIAGQDLLATYTFGTHTAQHHFCSRCGVKSFYVPRSHPDGFSVNARCLDGDAADRFKVCPFDGANWEENVASIR